MFCQNCGKEIQERVKFCPSCGAEVGSVNSEVENSAQKDNSNNSTASGSTRRTQSVGSEFGSIASKVNINIPTSVKNVDSSSIKNLLKNKGLIWIVR
jgi:predicted ATP-dependent serine protease